MNPFFNQVLFFILIVITIAIIAAVRVGALWLRMALIALLITMLTRRIDNIGAYFGLDLINQNVTDLITLLTIAIIFFTFLAAYVRKPYLLRAEKERQMDLRIKHGPTINQIEELREKDEATHGQPWSMLVPYPSRLRK